MQIWVAKIMILLLQTIRATEKQNAHTISSNKENKNKNCICSLHNNCAFL
jgi:hypothetical protein